MRLIYKRWIGEKGAGKTERKEDQKGKKIIKTMCYFASDMLVLTFFFAVDLERSFTG